MKQATIRVAGAVRPARRGPRGAFTLVELLVVIGIIAVLISVLLPVLSSARKSSDKATCLASLKQIGDAYKMYQIDYKGAWPVAAHYFSGPPMPGVSTDFRDKRWHDFVGKYLIGNQGVIDKATNQKYTSNEVNFNGTVNYVTTNNGQYATHGEFGTQADPVWIGTLRDRKSVLWGCPSWGRITAGGTQYEFGSNNGYAMNIFPNAPNDIDSAHIYGLVPKRTAAIRNHSIAGSPFVGSYHKMTAWSRPGDRALVFDGVHNGGYFADKGWNTAINPPYAVLDPTIILPLSPNSNYPIDWNRHGKSKPGKVRASELTLNMLFCDGHAAPVSAREAYKAIRFQ